MAGKIIADQIEHSTAGSLDTQYVVNGSAKAWVNFNGSGTVAIRGNQNVASITDSGTGDFTANYTNAMDDTNYASLGSCIGATNNVDGSVLTGFASGTAKTVSYIRVRATYAASNTLLDPDNISVAIFGDLA